MDISALVNLASASPATGDNFPIVPVVGVGVVAVIVAVISTIAAAKKKNDDDDDN